MLVAILPMEPNHAHTAVLPNLLCGPSQILLLDKVTFNK